LVISNLVLPFNHSSAIERSTEVNKAVFRLSGVVFFSKDIQDSLKSLAILNCIHAGSKSRSPSFIEIYSSSRFSELSALKESPSSLTDDKLLSLIKIEKLKLSALGRSKESLSKRELRALSQKCEKLKWSALGDDQKSLLISEVFLRDRFGGEKDVYNRLVEYARSLSIQESHEVYATSGSPYLKSKYKELKGRIEQELVRPEDKSPRTLNNSIQKK